MIYLSCRLLYPKSLSKSINGIYQKSGKIMGLTERKLFFDVISFTLFILLIKSESSLAQEPNSSFDVNFDTAILAQLIPANYNSLEPPPKTNGQSTKVSLSVIIMNVRDIDEETEKITIEMNLRTAWRDNRLTKPARNGNANDSFRVFSPKLLDKIWHPDAFIDHSIKVRLPAITTAPASLRMYRDGVIRYSARLTVTIACKMDFHLYPVDTQGCPVDFMSYAYPASVMDLEWDTEHGSGGVIFAHPMDLPNFRVELTAGKKLITNTTSAMYSNLQFEILLRRNITYHLIQIYLPSFIFLVVSWISFLIPKRSAPERITVCSLTLLSLVVMLGDLGVPKVSYMTALHIWMITCVLFVFVSFVEFVFVLKFRNLAAAKQSASSSSPTPHKKVEKLKGKRRALKLPTKNSFELKDVKNTSQESVTPSEIPAGGGEGASSSCSNFVENHAKIGEEYLNMARKLDRMATIVLPTIFLIFNILYWTLLLTAVRSGK